MLEEFARKVGLSRRTVAAMPTGASHRNTKADNQQKGTGKSLS